MKSKILALFLAVALGISMYANLTLGKSNESEPTFEKVMIQKISSKKFYTVVTADGQELSYAYYVIKDGKILEKFSYRKDAHFAYNVKEPGTYRVTVFIKDEDGNIESQPTKEIKID